MPTQGIPHQVLSFKWAKTLDFNTFCSSTFLDYNNSKYVSHPTLEVVKKELGKIAINPSYLDKTPVLKNTFPVAWRILFTFVIQKDSVSLFPLVAKPKKGKSHTVTPTLPKSQGPEVPGALSKKSKRPMSKKPPIETKSTATHPKDLKGNIQPIDRNLTTTTSSEGTAKIMPYPEGSLGDKDSGENIPPADMEPIQPTITDLSVAGAKYQSPPPQANKPQSSHAPSTKASNTDSECDDTLKKYDNILSLTERQLVKYLRKVSNALFARITEDNWEKHETDKLVEASMSFLNKSSNTISDLYKGLNIITKLLKEIKNAVKDDSAHAPKQGKELAAWAKSSTNMAWNLSSKLSGQSLGSITPTLTLTHIPANVEGENATNTATEKPPSHTKGEIEQPKMEIPISSIQPTEVPPTQAQPITTITTHLESSQAAPIIDKGKGIETDSDEDPSKKLMPALTIVCSNPDEEAKVPYMINRKICYLINKEMQDYLDKVKKPRKVAEEERLLAISKPEVIKVVQEEAEKIRLDPKKIVSAKAGEKFKKAQILKTRSSRENTLRRGTDGRNSDVHKPFAFGAFGISELDELREIIPKNKNTVV
ncbi:hypothetical protein Tco_0019435 [Tanacetum coccineum]